MSFIDLLFKKVGTSDNTRGISIEQLACLGILSVFIKDFISFFWYTYGI